VLDHIQVAFVLFDHLLVIAIPDETLEELVTAFIHMVETPRKMCGRISGWMPMPSSLISTPTWSPFGASGSQPYLPPG